MRNKLYTTAYILVILGIAAALYAGYKPNEGITIFDSMRVEPSADCNEVTTTDCNFVDNIPKSKQMWIFQGTYCSECSKLYDYLTHPKICPDCNKVTQDCFFLARVDDR